MPATWGDYMLASAVRQLRFANGREHREAADAGRRGRQLGGVGGDDGVGAVGVGSHLGAGVDDDLNAQSCRKVRNEESQGSGKAGPRAVCMRVLQSWAQRCQLKLHRTNRLTCPCLSLLEVQAAFAVLLLWLRPADVSSRRCCSGVRGREAPYHRRVAQDLVAVAEEHRAAGGCRDIGDGNAIEPQSLAAA